MTDTLASIHPFVVHFAVSLTLVSAGFDVADFLLRRDTFERTAFALAVLALPALLLAALTGNLAASRVTDPALLAIVERHELYANIAVWTFSAAALWRIFLHLKRQFSGLRMVIYVFIITAAAMSVFLAARRGGSIRHDGPPKPTAAATFHNERGMD
jgi:uncharacterized membrane protein